MMSNFKYFLENPVTGDDGYHLRAADAKEISKFFEGLKKSLNGGGWFIKALPPQRQSDVARMLFEAYRGRMPIQDATRICMPDILKHFKLGVDDAGFVVDLKAIPQMPYHEIKPKIERALCLRCGEYKQSAFERCYNCKYAPTDNLSAAKMMMFTDKTVNKEILDELSQNVKQIYQAGGNALDVMPFPEDNLRQATNRLEGNSVVQVILKRNRDEER